jgi:predicted O-methyltransferase YrrM
MIKTLLDKLPYVKKLKDASESLRSENLNFYKNCAFPPGHFYSVLVSVDDIKKRENEIWQPEPPLQIPGIDLQIKDQLELVHSLQQYYADLPFSNEKQEGLRYNYSNDYFCHTDGIMLYSMMRHFKPERIIEIGSGYSSALMLDTNELFFDSAIELTFIEPYPERLFSLLKNSDTKKATIIEDTLQSVSPETFEQLRPGDILFVDSTHVVKTGSDVNRILFQILPVLKSGVFIHFHDIHYPFEYPKNWVLEGRNWNETYFLKAFLMYNAQFEIRLFNTYLHALHSDIFNAMPVCYHNQGSSIWLQKK